MDQKEKYIPALNQNWLTPLYDPLLKWGMRADTFKRYLVEHSHLEPSNFGMRLISIPISRMEEAGDNVRGLLPGMLRDAGFQDMIETGHFQTLFGELVHYQARHPKIL
jgi:hypothetical protein